MSKAFTKDDDANASEVLVVPRAPLPDGVSNYVTPRGLRALRLEQTVIEQRRSAFEAADPADRLAQLQALARRAYELAARIASAELVLGQNQPQGEVRFGARVTLRTESGQEASYQIVGVDEAEAAAGRIAFTSPLARALLGVQVGGVGTLRTPRGSEELEVLAVAYETDE
ncbi:MAG: GreA/GreB family elongation factor [Polyangiaceae bacterium]